MGRENPVGDVDNVSSSGRIELSFYRFDVDLTVMEERSGAGKRAKDLVGGGSWLFLEDRIGEKTTRSKRKFFQLADPSKNVTPILDVNPGRRTKKGRFGARGNA